MKIIKAKNIGFCFGVKNAYETIIKESKNFPKPVYILGDLVHNDHVMKEVFDLGIKKIKDPFSVSTGTIIITAHGGDPFLIEKLTQKGINVVDTTCPKVAFVIKKARELEQKGYKVLIFGNKKHKEVKAINAAILNKGIVFSDYSEIFKRLNKQGTKKDSKLSIISQTTKNIKDFLRIADKLKKVYINLEVQKTICFETLNRQKEAKEKAVISDIALVIGSKTSENTKELLNICYKNNSRSYLIDKAEDLEKDWLFGAAEVFICAGASTPDYVIEKVVKSIKLISK